MSLTQKEIGPVGTTTATNLHTDSLLYGYRLLAARITWIALALAIIALNVLALPGFSASLLTPDVVQELHHLNFSPALYITLNIGMTGVCMLLYLAIAVLLFWLKS